MEVALSLPDFIFNFTLEGKLKPSKLVSVKKQQCWHDVKDVCVLGCRDVYWSWHANQPLESKFHKLRAFCVINEQSYSTKCQEIKLHFTPICSTTVHRLIQVSLEMWKYLEWLQLSSLESCLRKPISYCIQTFYLMVVPMDRFWVWSRSLFTCYPLGSNLTQTCLWFSLLFQ